MRLTRHKTVLVKVSDCRRDHSEVHHKAIGASPPSASVAKQEKFVYTARRVRFQERAVRRSGKILIGR